MITVPCLSSVTSRTQRQVAFCVMSFMTVQDLRVNAVQLLARALEAGNRGQFTAAEQLTALAAQYFDDANLIEVAERQPITKGAG